MSDKNKITLPLVLYTIGLIFYTILTIIGFLYISRGNYIVVGICSLVVLGILMFLSDRLEKNKEKNPEENLGSEKALRLLYLAAASLFFIIIFHAINVEFISKNEIIKSAKDKLLSIENLVLDYQQDANDMVNSFKDSVENNLDCYILSEGKNSSCQKNVENLLGEGTVNFDAYKKNPKLPASKNQLKEEADAAIETNKVRMEARLDLGAVEEERQRYSTQVLAIFDNWHRTKVGYYYDDINDKYSTVYNATIERIPNFEYPAALESNKINLYNPFGGITVGALVLSLFISIILNALVLAPYFATQRPETKIIKKPIIPNDKDYGDIPL